MDYDRLICGQSRSGMYASVTTLPPMFITGEAPGTIHVPLVISLVMSDHGVGCWMWNGQLC
jgi:hypothetical protein